VQPTGNLVLCLGHGRHAGIALRHSAR
jgi:hypothetical protein